MLLSSDEIPECQCERRQGLNSQVLSDLGEYPWKFAESEIDIETARQTGGNQETGLRRPKKYGFLSVS